MLKIRICSPSTGQDPEGSIEYESGSATLVGRYLIPALIRKDTQDPAFVECLRRFLSLKKLSPTGTGNVRSGGVEGHVQDALVELLPVGRHLLDTGSALQVPHPAHKNTGIAYIGSGSLLGTLTGGLIPFNWGQKKVFIS